MNITISMPKELIKKLKDVKDRTGIPVSTYITKVVERAIKGEE